MEEVFLTVSEICTMLKVSEPWVYRLIKEERIPFFRIAGKAVRFKQSEVLAWIEAGRDQRYYRDKWRETEIQG
jgi:excisionase family DNA binding protein